MVNFLFSIDMFVSKILANKFPESTQTNLLLKFFSRDFLDNLFKVITKFGEGYFEIMVILFLGYMIYRNHEKKQELWILIKGVFYSFLFSGILVNILKRLIGRERPYVAFNPDNFHSVLYMIKNNMLFDSRYQSFPSGHTITIFSTVWFLYLNTESKAVKGLLIFIGVMVGLSRIYLSYHWFSDVMMSIFLSYKVARIINLKLREKNHLKTHEVLPYKC